MHPLVSWLRRPKRPKLFSRVWGPKSFEKQAESIVVKSKSSEDSGETSKAVPLPDPVDSNGPSPNLVGSNGIQSFHIPKLSSDKLPTPTGMREDVLLLAWLLVLLRIREDGQAEFEWTYDYGGSFSDKFVLSSEKAATSLQSNVEEVTSAISQHVAEVTSRRRMKPASRPVSVFLSTGVLSREVGSKDDVNSRLSIFVDIAVSHPSCLTDSLQAGSSP